MQDRQDQTRALLEDEAIAQHWKDISAPLSRLLEEMDQRDHWAIDRDAEFLDHLSRLIHFMEGADFAASAGNGENAGRLAVVMAYLTSSRFMRVLEMFEKRQPGVVNRMVLSLARLGGSSERYSNLFFERLLLVHRGELLAQIFSVDRANRIAGDVEMLREILG